MYARLLPNPVGAHRPTNLSGVSTIKLAASNWLSRQHVKCAGSPISQGTKVRIRMPTHGSEIETVSVPMGRLFRDSAASKNFQNRSKIPIPLRRQNTETRRK